MNSQEIQRTIRSSWCLSASHSNRFTQARHSRTVSQMTQRLILFYHYIFIADTSCEELTSRQNICSDKILRVNINCSTSEKNKLKACQVNDNRQILWNIQISVHLISRKGKSTHNQFCNSNSQSEMFSFVRLFWLLLCNSKSNVTMCFCFAFNWCFLHFTLNVNIVLCALNSVGTAAEAIYMSYAKDKIKQPFLLKWQWQT